MIDRVYIYFWSPLPALRLCILYVIDLEHTKLEFKICSDLLFLQVKHHFNNIWTVSFYFFDFRYFQKTRQTNQANLTNIFDKICQSDAHLSAGEVGNISSGRGSPKANGVGFFADVSANVLKAWRNGALSLYYRCETTLSINPNQGNKDE